MTLYRAGGEGVGSRGWEGGGGPFLWRTGWGRGEGRMGKGHLGLGSEAGGGSAMQDVGPGGRGEEGFGQAKKTEFNRHCVHSW